MTVLQGQSLLDIAIQELGTAEAAFDLAVLNGMSLTYELEAGDNVKIPAVCDATVVNYYKLNGIHPATALSNM